MSIDAVGHEASPDRRAFDDERALACELADWLCARARAAGRRFTVCLSGGSTPRRLYLRLAEPAVASRFPWDRTHWFWGDERFVPHDDPRSNYGMARETFLSRVPVPGGNVHPIPVAVGSPERAAAGYERTLERFHGAGRLDPRRPIFDVTLLGVGDDGHTASLFPGDSALEERERWVVAVVGPTPPARITLTYPVLDSSRDVVFLVTGERKRAVLQKLFEGNADLPAARVRPVGRVHWFFDRDAAPRTAC